MFVECPACEEQFQIQPNGLGKQHACPGCHRSFEPASTVSELRTRTEETSVGEFSESVSKSMEPPTSKLRTEFSESATKSPPKIGPPMAEPTAYDPASIEQGSGDIRIGMRNGNAAAPPISTPRNPTEMQLASEQTISSRIKVRRNTKSPLIMGLIALIGLIGIFGVLFVAMHQLSRIARTPDTNPGSEKNQSMLERASETASGPNEVENKSKVSRGKRTPKADDAGADADGQESVATFVTEPTADEKPETFALAEFEQVWSKIYSYMVKLEIETPWGTREATGFVIDSRGWVATSYQAIKDAKEINVILAARDFDSGKPWKEQSDKSRGIIAKDPARDLAIIAINRDLVINFTDMEIDEERVVVGGRRMILVRTPGAARRLWLTEVRIDRREKFVDLNEELRTQLTVDDNRDAFERWLVHSLPIEDPLRGAPLINRDGQVVGINSNLKAPGKAEGFTLPIKHLIALKNQANETPTPFSPEALAEDNSDKDTTVGNDAGKGQSPPLEPVAKSKFVEIDDLNRSFGDCKEFQFVGRDVEEVEKVELFVSRLKLTVDLSFDENLDRNDREDLAAEVENIMDQTERVVGSFGGELTKRIKDMNDMMLLDLDGQNAIPVALICEVEEGAASSPVFDSMPTVTLRASGTNNLFFATLAENTIVMPPGKTIMLFGYANPKRLLSVGGSDRMKIDLLFGSEVRAYGGE